MDDDELSSAIHTVCDLRALTGSTSRSRTSLLQEAGMWSDMSMTELDGTVWQQTSGCQKLVANASDASIL